MTIISVIKSNTKRIHTNSIILLHQEHFICIFFSFSLLYYAHTHTNTYITQPTDFLPSNYINFYVRQLTSKKCLRFLTNLENFTHTTHRVARCATKKSKNNLKKYSKPISSKNKKHFNSTNHTESNQKCQMVLIRTTFIYFYFQTGMVYER